MNEPGAAVDQIAHATIGAAIEVHSHLGAGFLESVYEESLAVEMALRGISFSRQHPISLSYKKQPVGAARLDFLVGGCLVVELKAVDALHPIHSAQVINYLRATGHALGLLINFNVTRLRDGGIKRVVLTQ